MTLNVGRLALALLGLVMIALTYITGNVYFLVVAIIAFFVGLYLMGATKKQSPKQDANQDKKGSKKKQSKTS